MAVIARDKILLCVYDYCLQDKLRLITVLGAGLLVGTALAVIIPEGVHAMYANGQGKLTNGFSFQIIFFVFIPAATFMS